MIIGVCEVVVAQNGASRALQPIDVGKHPALAALIAAVGLDDLEDAT